LLQDGKEGLIFFMQYLVHEPSTGRDYRSSFIPMLVRCILKKVL